MRSDPDLSEYYRSFADNYAELNYDKSLAGRMLRGSHKIIERKFSGGQHFSRVAEVGAGTGQHLQFVRHQFDEYLMTDFSIDMLRQVDFSDSSGHAHKVKVSREDATSLSFPDQSIDRLIATHVLEHLPEPHLVLREWNRVVRPGGWISVVLPCDPGVLWRLGRTMGPRRRATRMGIAYDYVMAREHINSITNLVALVRHYFEDVEEIWSPMGLPVSDLNLFYACHIRRT